MVRKKDIGAQGFTFDPKIGMHQSQYLQYRKARGLKSSWSALQIRIATGYIVLNLHGKIDPVAADVGWVQYRAGVPAPDTALPSPEEQSRESFKNAPPQANPYSTMIYSPVDRKALAEAKKKELELEIMKGRLIWLEDASMVMNRIAEQFKLSLFNSVNPISELMVKSEGNMVAFKRELAEIFKDVISSFSEFEPAIRDAAKHIGQDREDRFESEFRDA